ncbi:MAG: glycosyltransferase family 2 protein [Winogradskyella sp.]|uniref:glycosyltransferase family 2 protein n=1 Tax=Winogradskyella sp. TaxID=1883156 RepID=UPI000F3AE551|nr:glycosyltransferase family A protein [Winogradskyella sp.]RNC84985.1 MAG: glycosyltransferase family 2 protein [Winogradskyella sp.]
MTESIPFFSVVIPLYNKEDYIERTLRSVINQSFNDYEIIVINDGSTDKSLEKLKPYINKGRLRIITQLNKGLSYSRNEGFRLSEGQYVAFLDADDYWHPDYLLSHKASIEAFPKEVIFGTSYSQIIDGKALDIITNIDQRLKGKTFVLNDFFTANIRQFIPCQSTIVLRKNAFELPLYDESITYFEDVDFYLNHCTNKSVVITYKPLAYIEFSQANQMSKTALTNKILPDLSAYKKQYRGNKTILNYIDMQLYKIGIKYAVAGETEKKKEIISIINMDSLTFKQRMLISKPNWIIKRLIDVKKMLLKLNIRMTSF